MAHLLPRGSHLRSLILYRNPKFHPFFISSQSEQLNYDSSCLQSIPSSNPNSYPPNYQFTNHISKPYYSLTSKFLSPAQIGSQRRQLWNWGCKDAIFTDLRGPSMNWARNGKNPSGCDLGMGFSIWVRFSGSRAAAEASTSDGLTVERILANQWTIMDESESDWKSHASAIAQSIHLIKKRLQWKKLMVRLDLLAAELNKPNLWDDPVHAGKISREHGSLMSRVKEVKEFERELYDHIDMLKLAREEGDAELESVRTRLF